MSGDATMTFESITSGDQSVTPTVLYTDTPGTLELRQSVSNVQEQYSKPMELYTFYPATWLSGIVFGVKGTDGAGVVYQVQKCEEFDDHQEVNLRKLN